MSKFLSALEHIGHSILTIGSSIALNTDDQEKLNNAVSKIGEAIHAAEDVATVKPNTNAVKSAIAEVLPELVAAEVARVLAKYATKGKEIVVPSVVAPTEAVTE